MAYLGFVPPGVVLPFAGSTAPQGWLLCDGTSTGILRTTYAALFAAIGTTYGVGDGSTTFNLPDMRGVFPRGAGTNGTANYGGVSGHTPAGGSLGAKGGQKTSKNGLALSGAVAGGTASLTGSVAGGTASLTGSVSNGTLSTSGSNIGFGDSSQWVVLDGGTVSGGIYAGGGNGLRYQTAATTSHSHGISGSVSNGSLAVSNTAANNGTLAVSNTAASNGTLAVGAGDSETTPASLALNYIIKI